MSYNCSCKYLQVRKISSILTSKLDSFRHKIVWQQEPPTIFYCNLDRICIRQPQHLRQNRSDQRKTVYSARWLFISVAEQCKLHATTHASTCTLCLESNTLKTRSTSKTSDLIVVSNRPLFSSVAQIEQCLRNGLQEPAHTTSRSFRWTMHQNSLCVTRRTLSVADRSSRFDVEIKVRSN